MVGHGGSSASSYLADPTSPIPSHCASIVATSTVRVNQQRCSMYLFQLHPLLVTLHQIPEAGCYVSPRMQRTQTTGHLEAGTGQITRKYDVNSVRNLDLSCIFVLPNRVFSK